MNGKEARPNKETRAEKCLIVESDLRNSLWIQSTETFDKANEVVDSSDFESDCPMTMLEENGRRPISIAPIRN